MNNCDGNRINPLKYHLGSIFTSPMLYAPGLKTGELSYLWINTSQTQNSITLNRASTPLLIDFHDLALDPIFCGTRKIQTYFHRRNFHLEAGGGEPNASITIKRQHLRNTNEPFMALNFMSQGNYNHHYQFVVDHLH